MLKWLDSYFTFSQGQRNGILVLVGLTVACLLAPSVYVYFKPVAVEDETELAKDIAAFTSDYNAAQDNGDNNALDTAGPYNSRSNAGGKGEEKGNYVRNETSKTYTININTASAEDFEKLPGIGQVLGVRIIKFRTLLGGFAVKEQLKEVYGLPDSTYQNIKQQLVATAAGIDKINLNTADYKTLKAHPYIKAEGAKAIETYRKQHGNFKAVSELKGVLGNDSIYRKAAPYMAID
jgi:competence ComEA-like helix-hairpin-helix protein